MIRCAFPLTTRRWVSTPLPASVSSSSKRTPGSTTTPLPMTGVMCSYENSARHELESEGLAVHDHRMTGVVAALVADDEVHLFGDEVGEFALTLVAPLRADHDRCRHAQPLQLWPG